MDCSKLGFPVHYQLPELAQTHVHGVSDAIQPSHPLSEASKCCWMVLFIQAPGSDIETARRFDPCSTGLHPKRGDRLFNCWSSSTCHELTGQHGWELPSLISRNAQYLPVDKTPLAQILCAQLSSRDSGETEDYPQELVRRLSEGSPELLARAFTFGSSEEPVWGIWAYLCVSLFWPCGVLVPWPGLEPMPLALEVWSLNYSTTGEIPAYLVF